MAVVNWSRHSKQRFAERAVRYGVNYGDLEMKVVKQEVRVKEPGKDKFKAVFGLGENVFSVVKLDRKKFIHVLTLWEANEEEVRLWKKKTGKK